MVHKNASHEGWWQDMFEIHAGIHPSVWNAEFESFTGFIQKVWDSADSWNAAFQNYSNFQTFNVGISIYPTVKTKSQSFSKFQ